MQRKHLENVETTNPFQVLAMDHIPSLLKSHKENAVLLIWANLYIGYVMTKLSASRTAQTVAEGYK